MLVLKLYYIDIIDISMNHSIKKGFSFGLVSGIITTLGLIVGLHSSSGSIMVIIGGVLVIAVADAMSDALGIHLAEEANPNTDHAQVWSATIMTFLTKFVFSISFAIPLLLLPLGPAVIASVAWGLFVIVLLSYFLAKSQGESPLYIIGEHVGIAVLVVVLSHYIGVWVAATFS